MWETIEKALADANRAAAAFQGTAWGGAIGGLVAALTEGTRFARNKVDKLTKRIDDLETKTESQSAQLAKIFVPVVQPGTPQTTFINAAFSSNGGTVSVSGDDRAMRVTLNNAGVAVANDTKLVTIKFGKPYTAAPKVLLQRVGQGGSPSDSVEVYPDQATTQSFDLYVDTWIAAEPKATFDVLVFGPQQAEA